ncbi:MAG: hypothetical protein MUQ30_21045 [Anaerolineae bacterium]|nr:hypothetical protein [Anaerolineae bacterium]
MSQTRCAHRMLLGTVPAKRNTRRHVREMVMCGFGSLMAVMIPTQTTGSRSLDPVVCAQANATVARKLVGSIHRDDHEVLAGKVLLQIG